MTRTVTEIRRSAEERLRELEPLLAEAGQLRSLLAALDDTPGQPQPATAPAQQRSIASAPRGRARGRRAPQGANKQLILGIVADNPGVAAPEIAAMTELKRHVVSSTISRLKRAGELEPQGSGVRTPAGASDQVVRLGRDIAPAVRARVSADPGGAPLATSERLT